MLLMQIMCTKFTASEDFKELRSMLIKLMLMLQVHQPEHSHEDVGTVKPTPLERTPS